MSSYEIYHTVHNLLHNLAEINPNLDWRLQCRYSDGQHQTIMEVSLYTLSRNSRHGVIAYQHETGEVLNFFYSGLKGHRPDDVIDLMLDILNHEKAKVGQLAGQNSSS